MVVEREKPSPFSDCVWINVVVLSSSPELDIKSWCKLSNVYSFLNQTKTKGFSQFQNQSLASMPTVDIKKTVL